MVVFFDIDGTIVDEPTQQIPPSVARAVTKLCENGHVPVVNTGRPYSHIDPRVRAMDFQGWICGCGMQIILNGECIRLDVPTLEVCEYVVRSVRECNMQVLYETMEGEMLTDGEYSRHNPIVLQEAANMRAKGFTVCDIDTMPTYRFFKGGIWDGPGCDRQEMLRRLDPYFDYVLRTGTMIELVNPGCTKAVGMKILLDHLGVEKKDTIAIGDSHNDIPMFEASGQTICLGNGVPELKARADYVTDTVLNDGIEKALLHFGLI